MKKLTAFFAVLFLAVTLAACASKPLTAAEKIQAAEGLSVYKGSGFAFVYDKNIWSDFSSSLEGAGEAAAELGVDISDEGTRAMNDGVFMYVPDNTVSFNVVVNAGGHNGKKVDYDDTAAQMESQYGTMTGVDFLGYDVIELNGYEYLKIDIQMAMAAFGVNMRMTQYAHFTKDKNYVVTFTAADESSLNAFEAVLATFEYDD